MQGARSGQADQLALPCPALARMRIVTGSWARFMRLALFEDCHPATSDLALRLAAAQRRPLPCGVNQGQHPHGVAFNFIDEPVAFMWHQLAGAGNLAGVAEFGMVGQPGCGGAEQSIHARRCARAVRCDVAPNLVAVLLRFRCPDDFHAFPPAPARRAANLASTSSLLRPTPARIDALPASTLLARKAS